MYATWYPNPGIKNVKLSTPSISYFRDYINDPKEEKIIDVNY
jgi:hypothetical protein